MNTITVYDTEDGLKEWTCSCGASSQGNGLRRFFKRHPLLCSKKEAEQEAKRTFTHQIAQGDSAVAVAESKEELLKVTKGQKEAILEVFHNTKKA
jgi:hypothetical protein